MATRVFFRRHEQVERIHDDQDKIMSKEDYDRCCKLKESFNAAVMMEKPFTIPVPVETSERALLCFVLATKRVGERPKWSELDKEGGMVDGGVVTFTNRDTCRPGT